MTVVFMKMYPLNYAYYVPFSASFAALYASSEHGIDDGKTPFGKYVFVTRGKL